MNKIYVLLCSLFLSTTAIATCNKVGHCPEQPGHNQNDFEMIEGGFYLNAGGDSYADDLAETLSISDGSIDLMGPKPSLDLKAEVSQLGVSESPKKSQVFLTGKIKGAGHFKTYGTSHPTTGHVNLGIEGKAGGSAKGDYTIVQATQDLVADASIGGGERPSVNVGYRARIVAVGVDSSIDGSPASAETEAFSATGGYVDAGVQTKDKKKKH